MPETPDFDQIARRLQPFVSPQYVTLVVEQFRLVWNARCAADLAKIDTELSMMMGSTASGPYVKNLDRAIRALDR